MHELSVAQAILDAVKGEAEKHPGARPLRVGVRVGELSGVNPDSLSFCFECLVQGTEWEPLVMHLDCPGGEELELAYLELEEPATDLEERPVAPGNGKGQGEGES